MPTGPASWKQGPPSEPEANSLGTNKRTDTKEDEEGRAAKQAGWERHDPGMPARFSLRKPSTSSYLINVQTMCGALWELWKMGRDLSGVCSQTGGTSDFTKPCSFSRSSCQTAYPPTLKAGPVWKRLGFCF